MNKSLKRFLVVICLLGCSISFLAHLYKNRFIIDGILAPMHINIEIDKEFAHLVLIEANNDRIYSMRPTTSSENGLRNTVVYAKISEKEFIQSLWLRAPTQNHQDLVSAIDNITVFIGDRMFYFSRHDIALWNGNEHGEHITWQLPVRYAKSIIKPWINWYGDLNYLVKGIGDFIFFPIHFITTWFFIVCLIILFKEKFQGKLDRIELNQKRKNFMEIALVLVIVIFGFLLRINGYVRYSAWYDELYSATRAGSPFQPIITTFSDPGNPPLYFIVLRFWFIFLNWSESAGRLLSVLIGTLAILSIYFTVRYFSGRKSALLSALFMACSTYIVGFSQEMRAYILEIFLVPIVIFAFLRFLRSQTLLNLFFYILLGILIVNTHYYGALLISSNFVFFVVYIIFTKKYNWKKSFCFFFGNIGIALSLTPYFLYTAINRALLDKSFNTQIGKLNLEFFLALSAASLVLLCYCLFRIIYMKKENSQKYILLDYAIVVMYLIFIQAFVISIYRPILTWKYLTICIPFIMAGIAITVSYLWNIKRLRFAAVLLAFSFLNCLSEDEIGGDYDVYKANQEYISADIKAHPYRLPAILTDPAYIAFYKLPAIENYSSEKSFDIVYINPLYQKEDGSYRTLQSAGLNSADILKIVANDDRTIFKKVISP
ncbi:MAG: hypothetical protein Ta2B_01590 [Termitinemataceae bacterium]|nr:MAG: hypothetical protein Ta2B_01590 [Termitinemataceae bacterium]